MWPEKKGNISRSGRGGGVFQIALAGQHEKRGTAVWFCVCDFFPDMVPILYLDTLLIPGINSSFSSN